MESHGTEPDARELRIAFIDRTKFTHIIRLDPGIALNHGMLDSQQLAILIEAAADEVIRRHSSDLRRELVERVMSELEPVLVAATLAKPSEALGLCFDAIQAVTEQADVLGALLDGAQQFCGDCGLFVLRGNSASGWQSRGYPLNAMQRATIDCSTGLPAQALQLRTHVVSTIAELGGNLPQILGLADSARVVLLPMVVRERIPAMLLASGDSPSGTLDVEALSVLTRLTGLWLEALSNRKQAQPDTIPAPAPRFVTAPPENLPTSALEPPPPLPEPAPLPPPPAPPVEVAPPPAPVIAPPAAPTPEDELHSRARRFAKLLVEEIRLYNQSKVEQGRSNRDLYNRLQEDIEKSRAAYQKRFGTALPNADYFTQELVRILADNDPSLLGANFPR